ncbi:hypothetical protein BASA81_010948 [Batrachochytrium salamandrivorans]|nr:hypothetical protein BASA81_010948 [Batrachochytrium salamandrivorans]
MLHQMKPFVLLLVLLSVLLVQAVSLIALTPTLQNGFLVANTFHLRCLRSWLERQRTCTTRRQSVMDIPAQAPDQPAIVNPVAAVNPIATNGNDNMPQPVGAVHPHQYPQALPAAMYPGDYNPIP